MIAFSPRQKRTDPFRAHKSDRVRRGALAARRFLLHTFSVAHPIPESVQFCVHFCASIGG
jgi:hypothetical protein